MVPIEGIGIFRNHIMRKGIPISLLIRLSLLPVSKILRDTSFYKLISLGSDQLLTLTEGTTLGTPIGILAGQSLSGIE